MELEGRIILELPVQSGTSKAGNPWKKGEWVLETGGTYPRKVKFHIFGEERLANLGHNLQVGKDVVISFDLDSREYNGRWYTDVAVYAVRPAGNDMTDSGPGSVDSFGGGLPGGFPPPPAAPQGGMTNPGAGYNTPFGAGPAGPAAPMENSSDDLPF